MLPSVTSYSGHSAFKIYFSWFIFVSLHHQTKWEIRNFFVFSCLVVEIWQEMQLGQVSFFQTATLEKKGNKFFLYFTFGFYSSVDATKQTFEASFENLSGKTFGNERGILTYPWSFYLILSFIRIIRILKSMSIIMIFWIYVTILIFLFRFQEFEIWKWAYTSKNI